MQAMRSAEEEAAEDIFFGQVVLIWARWFVILAGIILTLWTATSASEITSTTLLVAALMSMNFFLHGRYLIERPANQLLLLAISLLDLLIISAIVLTWQGQVGLKSHFFIFYYPMLVAFAFVFPRRFTVAYTLIALAAYTVACLLADSSFVAKSVDLELLVTRLITLAAMGGLGTYYWRIQRDRRRAAPGIGLHVQEEQVRMPAPAAVQ